VARWLIKEEPAHYAWADLVRDGKTEWNGVHNALALRHLKAMRPGDRAIFYHTGEERACVGLVEIAGPPHPDAKDRRGSWSVAVRPVRALHRAIPLAEVKADPALASFDLVRLSRLTVMPVSDDHWARLMAHEDAAARPPGPAKAAGENRGRRAVRRRRSTSARRRG
jgi:predicted RNA-binding protein with PUA-like domain